MSRNRGSLQFLTKRRAGLEPANTRSAGEGSSRCATSALFISKTPETGFEPATPCFLPSLRRLIASRIYQFLTSKNLGSLHLEGRCSIQAELPGLLINSRKRYLKSFVYRKKIINLMPRNFFLILKGPAQFVH